MKNKSLLPRSLIGPGFFVTHRTPPIHHMRGIVSDVGRSDRANDRIIGKQVIEEPFNVVILLIADNRHRFNVVVEAMKQDHVAGVRQGDTGEGLNVGRGVKNIHHAPAILASPV